MVQLNRLIERLCDADFLGSIMEIGEFEGVRAASIEIELVGRRLSRDLSAGLDSGQGDVRPRQGFARGEGAARNRGEAEIADSLSG